MQNLVTTLDRLNRKERFFLLGHALGNPRFRLSENFRVALGYELGLEIPDNAFAWMDYHLDWVYAAVVLSGPEGSSEIFKSPDFPRAQVGEIGHNPKAIEPYNVNVNQEDTDLLVAFSMASLTHLIFVEAKGVTDFGNRQLHSKARRLMRIFGKDGRAIENVTPHFVLASPSEPRVHSNTYRQGLKTDDLPPWMLRQGRFVWISLPVPRIRHEIVRCDASGAEDPHGEFWRAKSEDFKTKVAEDNAPAAESTTT